MKYKVGISDSPDCECDLAVQDMDHIFWSCHLNSDPRKILINALAKKDIFPPFSVKHVLALLDVDVARAVIRFIRMANLSL